MSRAPAYTSEEDNQIVRLVRQGADNYAIAAAIGRPFDGVRARLRRLLQDGRLTEAEVRGTYQKPSGKHLNGPEGAGPVRPYGAVHGSAFERAKAKVDKMIAAGIDPHAARLEVKQTTGLAI